MGFFLRIAKLLNYIYASVDEAPQNTFTLKVFGYLFLEKGTKNRVLPLLFRILSRADTVFFLKGGKEIRQ